MAKTTWPEMVRVAPSAHLLVATLDTNAVGNEAAAGDTFDTERLRASVQLLTRLCTKLKLTGDYAVTPSRTGAPQVHCAFSLVIDRDVVAAFVETGPGADDPDWASRRTFLLDEAATAALVAIAGPGDRKGAGRRARADQEASGRHGW
jgi:hypothetical protein